MYHSFLSTEWMVYDTDCRYTLFVYLLTYSVALVRKRTIPTERPPLVGEVSASNLPAIWNFLLLREHFPKYNENAVWLTP
jgi:hypothetical protein